MIADIYIPGTGGLSLLGCKHRAPLAVTASNLGLSTDLYCQPADARLQDPGAPEHSRRIRDGGRLLPSSVVSNTRTRRRSRSRPEASFPHFSSFF